jgi:hypothetical protein
MPDDVILLWSHYLGTHLSGHHFSYRILTTDVDSWETSSLKYATPIPAQCESYLLVCRWMFFAALIATKLLERLSKEECLKQIQPASFDSSLLCRERCCQVSIDTSSSPYTALWGFCFVCFLIGLLHF